MSSQKTEPALHPAAARGGKRVAFVREVLADLDTPLSVYLKLARAAPYSYLLESVQGGEKWGRYSIIGLPARTVLRVVGEAFTVETASGEVLARSRTHDPFETLRRFCAQWGEPERSGGPDLRWPRFSGGLVGYFGYEAVRYIEPRLGPMAKPDPVGAPDILLMLSEELAVFDNLAGKLYLIVHADAADLEAQRRAAARLEALVAALAEPLPAASLPSSAPRRAVAVGEGDFETAFPRALFEQAVERAREYIRAGDIMQVVLSQRLSVPFTASPLDLYRALRTLNPSPYMYFMNLGGFHIVGSSPEILVRLEDGVVTVRPIAGTRPRGATEAEDRALEQELLADPKERAEHIMLVDLGRNDVGRVAKTGTVRVTDLMTIERYSHVMHIVSNVTGELAEGLDAIDVLKACFPAGTVTGAPKVRAMEIIEELEPTRRGVYAGAVGYISWSGNMDTAIAIRTAVIKDGVLYVQAGAGIVADSVPANEWHETMNKARAMFRAVAMACEGL
jgi:anthranilate synthase component 1